MERVPEEVDYEQVEEEMASIPGVNDVHDLHIWSLSVGKISLSVHLAADEHSSVLSAAQKVCKKHGITHVTIQVDPISKTKECESHNLH
jgi:Co/Zn/Cd efflux system component